MGTAFLGKLVCDSIGFSTHVVNLEVLELIEEELAVIYEGRVNSVRVFITFLLTSQLLSPTPQTTTEVAVICKKVNSNRAGALGI